MVTKNAESESSGRLLARLAEAYGGEHPADFAPLAQAYRQHFSGARP